MDITGGSAQRGRGIGNIVLGQRDHIHVAFYHQNALQLAGRLARLVEAVEFATLVKDLGLRRVEILGLVVPQYPAAKGDNAAAPVADRKHHAVAEAVVDLAVLVFHQHAGLDQQVAQRIPATQRRVQVVPARRREPHAELLRDLARQAARLQIIHRPRRLRVAAQLLAVEQRRFFHNGVERFIALLALRRVAPATAGLAGNGHAGTAGQTIHRLREFQVFVFHHERQRIAARATAEAIVELFVGVDAERGAALLVEGAAGGVILARLFQFDTPVYHLDDIDAVQQVIQKSLGYPSGHWCFSWWRGVGGIEPRWGLKV